MDKRIIYAALLVLPIISIIFIFFTGLGIAFTANKDVILPGIKIGEIDAGGLNEQQVTKKLTALQEELLQTTVTLTHQGHNWPLDLSQVGLAINTAKTFQQAIVAGRQGNIIKRWQWRYHIAKQGHKIQPILKLDTDRLEAVVTDLAGQFNIASQNANFIIDQQDQVVITPSQNGQQINIEPLAEKLLKRLLNSSNITLSLPMETTTPEYKTADIEAMGITGLLASYTTSYDATLVNRAYNIKVAANALDGLMVAPDEKVSFNEVVGPRSSEAGYKSAGVIVNDQLVDGVGGGVCQVSTTLYNAVLLAGLELIERHNHSLPVTYVPVGQDATVVYGALDFRFYNSTSHCVYLKTEVKTNQLTIKIFGNTTNNPTITVKSWVAQVLEPKTILQEDENIKKGQQVVKQGGSIGYVAKAERVFTNNGQEGKREALPVSRYKAVNKIIAVGTAEPEPTVTPPSDASTIPVVEQDEHPNIPAPEVDNKHEVDFLE